MSAQPKICVLVTVPPYWDHRRWIKVIPGLVKAGYEVVYLGEEAGKDEPCDFVYDAIPDWKRKLARMTGGFSVLRQVLRHKPDVLLICMVEQLPLGIFIQLFTKIKVIYECREVIWLSFRDHRANWPKWVRWPFAYFIRVLEAIATRVFSGMIASDLGIYKHYSGMCPEKKMIFYSVPLLSHFKKDYLPLAEREYDVVFMGSMSLRTGVQTLIEALGVLKSEGRIVKTLLLGKPDGPALEYVKKRRGELGLDKQITITGKIPSQQVPPVLAKAKIGIAPLLDLPKFHYNIACKVFEYMACGMPSICSDLPPQRLFVKQGQTGLFFEPGNTTQLVDCIKTLLDDLPKAEAMGQQGRLDVEKEWNAEVQQEKLKEYCAKLL